MSTHADDFVENPVHAAEMRMTINLKFQMLQNYRKLKLLYDIKIIV